VQRSAGSGRAADKATRAATVRRIVLDHGTRGDCLEDVIHADVLLNHFLVGMNRYPHRLRTGQGS